MEKHETMVENGWVLLRDFDIQIYIKYNSCKVGFYPQDRTSMTKNPT